MGTKSRETIYGASVKAASERAAEARRQADKLACEAWNARMLGFQGPAQPSPTPPVMTDEDRSVSGVKNSGSFTRWLTIHPPISTR